MTRSLFIGSLAGLASAMLVLTAASGPLGFVLSYLAPLPLFFAGLTHGFPAAALAGVVGTLISGLNELQAAGAYLIIFAAPAALLVRQALLARPAAEASGNADIVDGLEWYPAGRLVVVLVGWALGVFILALLLTSGHEGGLPGLLQPKIEQVLGLFADGMPQDDKPMDMSAAAEGLAKIMPSALGFGWLVMMVINGTLAQGLAKMVKQNRRPSPRYRTLALPRLLAAALAVAAVAAAILPDELGFVGTTAAVILAFPYLLQGLAVVHGVAARTAIPELVLTAFYAVLVVAGALGGILLILVAILGLIEEWAGFRRRLAGAGTSRET
jgi:hypothetical protein